MQRPDQPNVQIARGTTNGRRRKSRKTKVVSAVLFVAFAPVLVPCVIIGSLAQWKHKNRALKQQKDAEARRAERRAQVCPPLPASHIAERETKRPVTIEKRLSQQTLYRCHDQQQSPLFSKLPAEIRNEILAYAATPYDDPNFTYKVSDFWYRPGYHARHITSPAILMTCRRIYLEANHVHLEQARRAEHCFYFANDGLRPKWAAWLHQNEAQRLQNAVSNRNNNGGPHLHHVHIFAKTHWLESTLPGYTWLLYTPSGPKILTVTIQHTGWPDWENDKALCFKMGWLLELVNTQPTASTRLREIRLELETLEHKVDELDGIINMIRDMQDRHEEKMTELGYSSAWVLQEPFDTPPEYTWSGSTRLGGHTRGMYSDRKQLDYRVATLVWKSDFPGRRKLARWEDKAVRLSIQSVRCEISTEREERPDRSYRKVQEWEKRWRAQGSLLKFADQA